MIINCPHCGPREASEYTYVGDATTIRPHHDNTDMESWVDYVFMRNNPRGIHVEHWHHTSGCRAFLKVTRDTITHEITEVTLAGSWPTEKKS